MNIDAVVVNYNAKEHLLDCVSSLQKAGVRHLVVVDSCSSDGSLETLAEMAFDILAVSMDKNRGYGAAVNYGMKLLDEKFSADAVTGNGQIKKGDGRGHIHKGSSGVEGEAVVLVCNSDVIVSDTALDVLSKEFGKDNDLAIVGPKMLNPDGTVYPSFRLFPSILNGIGHGIVGLFLPRNRFSNRYKMADYDNETSRFVEWVSGACFMISMSAFEEVGGFDESYFMYGEDLDLCWRLKLAGWEVLFQPKGAVTHFQGVSADKVPYRMIIEHHRSILRFLDRSLEGNSRFILPFAALGLGIRATVICAKTACGSIVFNR
ncbi:MAG: glycosyltransferase family 2 protein [Actinobacteria bacterium]|nr:glycosyltransferase family 2 protein [Actinomycetota bacterium]MCL6105487.1 glycosyltransferase family 2 protein [Actinomycetota bacterium]